MTLIDFTLSNARRFYSSMGNPLAVKGLKNQLRNLMVAIFLTVIKSFDTKSSYICSDRRNLSKGRLHRVFVYASTGNI